jgi:F-type H+-transporting ATPase subunit epsilon
VTILAESAERPAEIDVARARAARDRAEQRLRPQAGEEVDAARATRALSRAQGRLQTAARRPGGA